MKVTGFSWHSGGCRCQKKETGDSFGSRGEGISGAGGAAPRVAGQEDGGPTPQHPTCTPHPGRSSSGSPRGGRDGGRGRRGTPSLHAPDPKCPPPAFPKVTPNWHGCPSGWGRGRHRSKAMGVMSEPDPLPASSESWSSTKNLDARLWESPCAPRARGQPAPRCIWGEKSMTGGHRTPRVSLPPWRNAHLRPGPRHTGA